MLPSRYYWNELVNALQTSFVRIENERSTNVVDTNFPTGIWIESFTPQAATRSTPTSPGLIYYITLNCRARNLLSIAPDANIKFAGLVQDELKTNAFFVATGTALSGGLETVETTNFTFGFGMTLQLKRPIKVD